MCERLRLKSQWIGDFEDHNGPLIVRERKKGLPLERIREEEGERQKFQRYDGG